jgi:hypothetical protein
MRRFLLGALALAALGCGTEGELGHGTFDYACVADEDTACWDSLTGPSKVPGRIVVGGLFALEYTPLEGGTLNHSITAASDRASTSSGSIQLLEDGVQSLLATDLTTDAVADFLNVEGVHAADLFVSEDKSDKALALASIRMADSATTYYVRPVDKAGNTLPGSLDYTWNVDDEGIAMVEVDSGSTAEATITPQSDGSTTLTIRGGPVEVTFSLRVEGVMMP